MNAINEDEIIEYLKDEIKKTKKRSERRELSEEEVVEQNLKLTKHTNPNIRCYSIILLKASVFTRHEEIYEGLMSKAHEFIIDDNGNVRYAAELFIKHAADYITALSVARQFIALSPLSLMKNTDLKRFDIAYINLFERLYKLREREQDPKKIKSITKCLKYRLDEVYRIAQENNNAELIKMTSVLIK